MIQNSIAAAIIICWIAATIYFMVRNYRKSKREGTPLSCCGCSAYKGGSCPHCATGKEHGEEFHKQ